MKTSKKTGQHCIRPRRSPHRRSRFQAPPAGTLGILGTSGNALTPPAKPIGSVNYRPKIGELIEFSGYTVGKVKRAKAQTKSNTTHYDFKVVAESKRALIKALGEGGIVLPLKADQDAVYEINQNLRVFPVLATASRPGWHDGCFVKMDGTVICPKGERPPEINFGGDLDRCSRRGKLSVWRQGIAKPLARHPIPAFVLMTAFASYLLPLTNRFDNFAFELIGKGGKGKSTCQLLAASALGPIVDRGNGQYWVSFNTTKAGTQSIMGMYSGHTIYMDETSMAGDGGGSKAAGQHLLHFAFQLSSGKTRTTNGSVAKETHRCIGVLSSNHGLERLADQHDSFDIAPALDRLLPLYLGEERPFGMFERKPQGYQSIKQFVIDLMAVASDNYGVAADRFIHKLVRLRSQNEAKLRQRIARRVQEFEKFVGASGDDGSAARKAEAFAIVMVAGELAQKFKILPGSYDCEKIAKYCYRLSQPKNPRSDAVAELLRLIEHPSTVHLDMEHLPTLSNAQLDQSVAFIYRPKGRRPQLLVWPHAFRRQFSGWAKMLRAPDVLAMLKPDCDRPTARRKVRTNTSAKDRFYSFELPYGTI